MVSRILIANRGEIALRVLRACRVLGIEAVVAYRGRPRVLARCSPTRRSASARPTPSALPVGAGAHLGRARDGCDAIHPGYGFLSEDDAFADAVRAHELTFIGPPSHVLERFASKEETRRLLAHGLPTIPGPACSTRPRRWRRRSASGTRSSSSRRPAAARACAWSARRASSRPCCRSAVPRRGPHSATTRCISSAGCRTTATSRSRSPSTGSATACTCGSDCRPSGATRRSSRRASSPRCPPRPPGSCRARHQGRRRGGLRERRHARVPRRQRRQRLLHRDQLPDPGGAPDRRC